jgi:RND family efflux transporter MFP subunit
MLIKKLLLFSSSLLLAEAQELVPVVSKNISRTVELPAELLPFLTVPIHARVSGYIQRVLVDRGSMVKPGQLLIELSAPEMQAQLAEQQAKIDAAESERVQAEANLAALQSTAERLRKAAQTPGAIAANELVQADKQVEAAQATVHSREQAKRSAEAAAQSIKEMEAYLKITAPFFGVVTERLAHPGALVGPNTAEPLLVIQQISRLRLVVPVPEADAGGIVKGAHVEFHTPAYPDRTYSGRVARLSHSLDSKTRTMSVELDVINRDGSLSPGMYPTVKWPVTSSHQKLLVPKTSVVTTTERTFVIRNQKGRAEWVDVKKGAPEGDLVEVQGNLHAGQKIVKRATDELREGAPLTTRKQS